MFCTYYVIGNRNFESYPELLNNLLATGPVFVSSLKFEVKEMMHQLPPLPYDDPNGILTDFRQHVLEKVSHLLF